MRTFRKRLHGGAVIASLGLTIGLMLVATPAQAATDCDATVEDVAGILGDGFTQVEAASAELETLGADVRVRTYQSFAPGATLDDWITQVQAGCPSWQAPDGSIKSNLVVFAMSMDERSVGIYYGPKWDNAFSGSNAETRIWGDFMVPQFQGGNFSQGFVDGINETNRVVNDYLHPSQAAPAGEATDSNAGWIVLIIFGSLVALALVGVAIYLIIRWQRRRAERKAVRLRALRARDAATTLLDQVGNSTRKTVRKAQIAKYSSVDVETARLLSKAEATLDDAYIKATDGMASAAAASVSADDNRLTINEYQELEYSYADVLTNARLAEGSDKIIDDVCKDVDEDLARVDSDITELQKQLTGLSTVLRELQTQGVVVTTIQKSADKAKQFLDNAVAHKGDLASLGEIGNANEQLDTALQALQTLDAQRAQLKDGLPKLKTRIDKVVHQLEPAKECFDRISSAYVESSWESVSGNGTEAYKRINDADALLTEATHDADLKQQNWDDAITKLQQANGLLDEAESVLRSVIALEANLAKSKEEAPHEIALAEADIQKAQQYIDAHKADVDRTHLDDVQRAKNTLDAARKELSESRPDYPKVIKLALTANSFADSIYAEAASEFETAERLRRQAVSSVREAASAISKAKEFIEDHRSDVKRSAEELLAQAMDHLEIAQRSTKPEAIIKAASTAEELAEDSYSKAHRNFRDAEEEREREEREEREERRRRQAAASSSYSSSFSSSSSWGSGSSHSSSSFGGSSGSFGGGGKIGGSSGGW